jgi:uncharacterized membrane protein
MRVPANWHKEHLSHLTVGERAADKLRNGMGSWGFVFTFIGIMIGWAILNTIALVKHWDEYPFILLNLFLSMLAGLQGAILLIAAKRADALSGAMAEHDYRTNVAAKEEIEALMAINREQLATIQEVRKLIETVSTSTQHTKPSE